MIPYKLIELRIVLYLLDLLMKSYCVTPIYIYTCYAHDASELRSINRHTPAQLDIHIC